MGIFDLFKKSSKQPKPGNYPVYLYTEEELDEYESYIEVCLGSFNHVFHEIASPDIHLDVIPIPPTEDHPYYKLVTMGAGAYPMNIPEKVKEYDLDYAEYMIFLPKDWNINSQDEKDFWPMRLLKNIGRLALYTNSWLAYGHTMSPDAEGTPFAENTRLNSMMLVKALDQYDRQMELKLSTGRKINFYQIIPLYEEELQYRRENGADALLDLLVETQDFPVVNINRNTCIMNSVEDKGEER